MATLRLMAQQLAARLTAHDNPTTDLTQYCGSLNCYRSHLSKQW